MDLLNNEPIAIGGVFRCCIQSLTEARESATEPPAKDAVIPCKYCSDGGMRWTGEKWQAKWIDEK